MTTFYVVFYAGLDYNDETHEIGGDGAGVLKNGFKTLEGAKGELKYKLKKDLESFAINDFGYDSGYEYPEAVEWLKSVTEGESYHYCSYTYKDRKGCRDDHGWNVFIKHCEDNGIEWLNKVPALYSVQEITV